MGRSLEIATDGWLSESSKRTLTLATEGWLSYVTLVIESEGGGGKEYKIPVGAEDEEILIIFKAFLTCLYKTV